MRHRSLKKRAKRSAAGNMQPSLRSSTRWCLKAQVQSLPQRCFDPLATVRIQAINCACSGQKNLAHVIASLHSDLVGLLRSSSKRCPSNWLSFKGQGVARAYGWVGSCLHHMTQKMHVHVRLLARSENFQPTNSRHIVQHWSIKKA